MRESLEELAPRARPSAPRGSPCPWCRPRCRLPQPFPLTTLVLNVTNQCNLSCTYCYEYGEDKLVDTQKGPQPKFMTEETARASVDFMLQESGANKVAHLTFFGGETLLNFPVLQEHPPLRARARRPSWGRRSTSASPPTPPCSGPEIIDFLHRRTTWA